LYDTVREDVPNLPLVRVYAPVGTYEELLPYLVRRLLENGANSSFVHQFLDPRIPVEQVVRDPVATLVRTSGGAPSHMGARPVPADASGIGDAPLSADASGIGDAPLGCRSGGRRSASRRLLCNARRLLRNSANPSGIRE